MAALKEPEDKCDVKKVVLFLTQEIQKGSMVRRSMGRLHGKVEAWMWEQKKLSNNSNVHLVRDSLEHGFKIHFPIS